MVEHAGERLEDRRRKLGRIARWIDVVTEEEQHVESVLAGQPRHRAPVAARRCPLSPTSPAMPAAIREGRRPGTVGTPRWGRAALPVREVRDDRSPVLEGGHRCDAEQQQGPDDDQPANGMSTAVVGSGRCSECVERSRGVGHVPSTDHCRGSTGLSSVPGVRRLRDFRLPARRLVVRPPVSLWRHSCVTRHALFKRRNQI